MMKKINLVLLALVSAFIAHSQTVSTFDNLTLGPDTFWNGSDLSGGFYSGHAFFENVYDTGFGGYWEAGFIYSDVTNDTTAGYTNAASAITGGGYAGSSNYAVAYDDGYGNVRIVLDSSAKGGLVYGFYVTNSTYAYLSMRNGDAFEHAFRDSDWFELTIIGWHNGVLKPDSVHFYLADFRSPDSAQHYIVNTWQFVDLRALGEVDSLDFFLNSSQVSGGSPLTPAYFCMDNFTASNQPDPSGPVTTPAYITMGYEQDTLINIISNYVTDVSGEALTLSLIQGAQLPGASAIILNNQIWYVPTVGPVAADTLVYNVCDVDGRCDSGLVVINLVGPSSIDGILQASVKVYPVPFTNFLSVEYPSDVKTLKLYDVTGRVVESFSCDKSESKAQLNTSTLANGSYILQLISESGTTVTRLTKQ